VAPDQIGFGKSAKPDIHYSFDLLAQNTAALLDHLGVDRVAVVGHSMGGMLAVRFARNYPQRTRALVLENPIGLEDYRMKVPPTPTEALFQKELHKSVEGVRAYYQTYFTQWKPAYEQFVEVNARVMLSGEYPRYALASARETQMIYQQPVRHEFHLIKAPTLLVVGLEDRTTLGRGQVSPEVLATLGQYPQLGRQAAKDIPHCKLIEIPGVGHIPHLDVPEQFNKDLLAFLDSVQGPEKAP
jgi:pimeloyl-ACP methyl ester carboxylesterase